MEHDTAFPPRGINELFAELWSLYLARVLRLLIISAVSAAVIFAFSWGLEQILPEGNQAEIDAILGTVPGGQLPTAEQQEEIAELQFEDFPLVALQSAVLIAVAMIVSAVAAGAYLFVIGAHYVIGRVMLSEALSFTAQRITTMIVTTVMAACVTLAVWTILFFAPFLISTAAGDSVAISALFGLLSFMGLIGAIVISTYVLIRWAFIWPVAAFEGLHGVNVLRRSWELTQGYWWRTFGILLVVLLAVFAISLPGLLAGGAGLDVVDTWYSNLIAPTLAGPIQMIMIFLLYADLRTRKEDPPGYGPEQIALDLDFRPIDRDDMPREQAG